MSTIAEFPNFGKHSIIPFTDDELASAKILREERNSLSLELRALIDPDIQLPIDDKTQQEEIQRGTIQVEAIEKSTSSWKEDDCDQLVYTATLTPAVNMAHNVQYSAMLDENELEVPMEVQDTTNRLYLTKEGVAAFASGNFERIDALEQQSQGDWRPIADRVQSVGSDCLVRVEYAGEGDLYVANVPEASAGSMWVTSKPPPTAPGVDPSTSRKITIHMYSASSGSISVSSSTWTKVPLWLLPHLVSLVIGCLTGYALRRGAAAFGVQVFQHLLRRLGIRWAGRAGVFARGAVKFGGGLLGAVAVEGLFWVAWRKYAFTMSIYVFDKEHHWKATHAKLDNAEFSDGNEFEPKDLGICSPPGVEIQAVGLRLMKQIEAGPSITYYNFSNSSEILRGLGAGMRFERDCGTQSAAAKFTVPRWTACGLNIEGNTPTGGLEGFYVADNWVTDQPKERVTAKTSGGTDVTALWSEIEEKDRSSPALQREYRVKVFLGKVTDFGLKNE